jgi:hypothetical protein
MLPAKKLGLLRESLDVEILGQDMKYFHSNNFIGKVSDYDLIEGLYT